MFKVHKFDPLARASVNRYIISVKIFQTELLHLKILKETNHHQSYTLIYQYMFRTIDPTNGYITYLLEMDL